MIEGRFLPTRLSRPRYAILLGLVLCVYFLDNPMVVDAIGILFFTYLFKPLMWLIIALVVYSFPSARPKGKLRTKQFIYWWSFIFAIVFITVQILAGLIDGLGKSPYDHSLIGMGLNLLFFGSALIGRELIRNHLVNSITRNENYFVFILITLFMTFIVFPMNKYVSFSGYEELVKFIAQFFIPEFSKNLLATYLVFLGGPIPSIIFMGILETFKWFSPILPNLQWITAALVGILTPVFLFTIMQSMFEIESKACKRNDNARESPASWIITTLISISIVWFSVGVFPIYPSVIATGSMQPMIFPGDVILVEKLKDMKDIQEGDVIQFRRDNILISHRIIAITEREGKIRYKTKGDNNSVEDRELVQPEQIKGEIVKVIPKIGWPTLLSKGDKNIPLEEIEF